MIGLNSVHTSGSLQLRSGGARYNRDYYGADTFRYRPPQRSKSLGPQGMAKIHGKQKVNSVCRCCLKAGSAGGLRKIRSVCVCVCIFFLLVDCKVWY